MHSSSGVIINPEISFRLTLGQDEYSDRMDKRLLKFEVWKFYNAGILRCQAVIGVLIFNDWVVLCMILQHISSGK